MDKAYITNLAERYGNSWFTPATMRFFNSRILDSSWTLMDRTVTPTGRSVIAETWRFVSSERFEDDPRRYTVREVTIDHEAGTMHVETVGDFEAYTSGAQAIRHIRD